MEPTTTPPLTYQEKIQAYNNQVKQDAEAAKKQQDAVAALTAILVSQKEIQTTIRQTLTGLVNYLQTYKPEVSVTNQAQLPDIQPVIDSINKLLSEVKNKETDFSKVVASLDNLGKSIAQLEIPEPLETVAVSNQIDYTKKFDELGKLMGKPQPAPVVNVPETKIPDNSKDFQNILKAIQQIKFPDIPPTDLSPVQSAVQDVTRAVSNLTFPVPNYVLPFKDTNGRAVQVQLDSNGKLPISGGGAVTIADGADVAEGSTGDATYTSGSGTVVALLKGLFAKLGSILTTQTDRSQFTKLTDGTDTALITSSGEQNVLATAQPGVDIGDVTINNTSGAGAVNIQDGGNSITVDGAVTTSGTATVTGNKLEDAVAVDGDAGLPILAVRNDSATSKTSTDGDYSMLASDAAGRLGITDLGGSISIDDNAGSLTVDGTVTSNQGSANATPWNVSVAAGANTIGSIASITTSVVPGTAATNLGKAEDTAHTSGDTGVMTLGVRNNASANFTDTDGDYSPFSVDAAGRQKIIETTQTATLTNVSGSASSVQLLAASNSRTGVIFFNDSVSSLYLKYGTTASTTSFTTKIGAGGYFEAPLPIYTGRIDGIWDAANGSVRITEMS